MATKFTPDYEDEKLTQIEDQKSAALDQSNQTYDSMIDQADKFYKDQIDASQQFADKQSQLQQENTDFTLEKIEQQKADAHKSYTKEQSGAYADWQKQSGQYGVNAEQMAEKGMTGTGYSESAQVSMYNNYQNRVATARETYAKAVLEYDNSMKEAMLQNNMALAEIAFNALQKKLELSLQGFQYQNQLITDKLNRQDVIDDRYYSRYQDVIEQMNYEKQMEEQVRQYEQNYQLQIKQYDEQIRQFNLEMERLKENDAKEYELQKQSLELQRQELEAKRQQISNEYELAKKQLELYQIDNTVPEETTTEISPHTNLSQYLAENPRGTGSGSGKQYITTPYYKGLKAENVGGYGYFDNGYQPKGVEIGGKAYKLKATGATVEFETQTLDGKKNVVEQTVWKADGKDGYYYYWEGRENKYKRLRWSDYENAYVID